LERYGYEAAPQERTFDTYNDVDCHHYSGLHDWTKFVKHGYGKALDHACREIRFGRLTREEGAALALKYRDRSPKDLGLFLAWLGMQGREFTTLLDAHRSPRAWARDSESWAADAAWTLLDGPENHLNDPGVAAAALPHRGPCDFRMTQS